MPPPISTTDDDATKAVRVDVDRSRNYLDYAKKFLREAQTFSRDAKERAASMRVDAKEAEERRRAA